MRTLRLLAGLALGTSSLSCGGTEPRPLPPPPSPSALAPSPSAAASAPAKPPKKAPADPCAPLTSPIEEVIRADGARVFTTDGTHLVWSDGHAIVRASMNGQDRTTLVADVMKSSEVSSLSISNGEVWFRAAKRYRQGCAGLVGFVRMQGGPVTSVTPEGCINGFALTPDQVVFTREETEPNDDGILEGIYIAPRKGGAGRTLARKLSGARTVVTDGTFAYTQATYESLARIPLEGGTFERVTDGKGFGATSWGGINGRLFMLEGDTFFAFHGHPNLDGYRVVRFTKDGKDPKVLGSAVPSNPGGTTTPWGPLVTDERSVYWTSPTEGLVWRAPKEGTCSPQAIADGRATPDWVTMVGSYAYWLESGATPPLIARRKLSED